MIVNQLVNPKVKDFAVKLNVTKEVKVPSLSMKQLCERFYPHRPLFLTLDIEGNGALALQGNDWSNRLCVPDVIFSEMNAFT
jgi:hypothetical protein